MSTNNIIFKQKEYIVKNRIISEWNKPNSRIKRILISSVMEQEDKKDEKDDEEYENDDEEEYNDPRFIKQNIQEKRLKQIETEGSEEDKKQESEVLRIAHERGLDLDDMGHDTQDKLDNIREELARYIEPGQHSSSKSHEFDRGMYRRKTSISSSPSLRRASLSGTPTGILSGFGSLHLDQPQGSPSNAYSPRHPSPLIMPSPFYPNISNIHSPSPRPLPSPLSYPVQYPPIPSPLAYSIQYRQSSSPNQFPRSSPEPK
jgi:hypothetical protein